MRGLAANPGLVTSGTGRWRAWRLALACLLLVPFGTAAKAGPPGFLEYDVKAAFLIHFPEFIEWPAGTFGDREVPVVIGVYGHAAMDEALDRAVRKAAGVHRFVVKPFRAGDDLKGCHILFLGPLEKTAESALLASLAGSAVLTVSETAGFASRGGMVNFYIERNKVRFEINPEAARQAGLRISSQLLQLGRLVGQEQREGP